MDSKVRELRDQFVTQAWSRQLYNGMCTYFLSAVTLDPYLADTYIRLLSRKRVCGGGFGRFPAERHRRRPHGRLPWQCKPTRH